MQFNISGTTLQTVSIDLQAGETVFSQRNVMAWMTDNVQMNTTTGRVGMDITGNVSGNRFFAAFQDDMDLLLIAVIRKCKTPAPLELEML